MHDPLCCVVMTVDFLREMALCSIYSSPPAEYVSLLCMPDIPSVSDLAFNSCTVKCDVRFSLASLDVLHIYLNHRGL